MMFNKIAMYESSAHDMICAQECKRKRPDAQMFRPSQAAGCCTTLG